MTLYTIGFTKTTAEQFFGRLRRAEVMTVLDTRLNRGGQLAGFAKVPDLPYFLRELANCGYDAVPALAPADDLIAAYRDRRLDWDAYAAGYRALLRERRPERDLSPAQLDSACLLCSEHAPDRCHRRLAAEYLRDAFAPAGTIEIVHL